MRGCGAHHLVFPSITFSFITPERSHPAHCWSHTQAPGLGHPHPSTSMLGGWGYAVSPSCLLKPVSLPPLSWRSLAYVVDQNLPSRSLGQIPSGKPVLTFNLKAKMLLGQSLLCSMSVLPIDQTPSKENRPFESLKCLSDDFLNSGDM